MTTGRGHRQRSRAFRQEFPAPAPAGPGNPQAAALRLTRYSGARVPGDDRTGGMDVPHRYPHPRCACALIVPSHGQEHRDHQDGTLAARLDRSARAAVQQRRRRRDRPICPRARRRAVTMVPGAESARPGSLRITRAGRPGRAGTRDSGPCRRPAEAPEAGRTRRGRISMRRSAKRLSLPVTLLAAGLLAAGCGGAISSSIGSLPSRTATAPARPSLTAAPAQPPGSTVTVTSAPAGWPPVPGRLPPLPAPACSGSGSCWAPWPWPA